MFHEKRNQKPWTSRKTHLERPASSPGRQKFVDGPIFRVFAVVGSTSEQHADFGLARQNKDGADIAKLTDWFEKFPPFPETRDIIKSPEIQKAAAVFSHPFSTTAQVQKAGETCILRWYGAPAKEISLNAYRVVLTSFQPAKVRDSVQSRPVRDGLRYKLLVLLSLSLYVKYSRSSGSPRLIRAQSFRGICYKLSRMSRRLQKRYLTPSDGDGCPLQADTQAVAEAELRETQNARKQALAALRSWMEQNPKFMAIRTDSNFLLRFLRAKKFSVPMAQEAIERYILLRQSWGIAFNQLDYQLPVMMELIDLGYIFVSPFKDKAGRRVVVYRPGRYINNHIRIQPSCL
ncbi:hypothetical protein evm_009286 [Chilo suppressalis]|nr:hypothetical protein evm_009286 [Chilo suppressalis]